MRQTAKTCLAGMALAALVASAPAHGGVVRAIELVHTESGHYFQTAYVPEAQSLLNGLLNWDRLGAATGQVHRVDDAPGPGLVPVCRFYTSAFAHKATHFFTAVQAECDAVKANPLWFYEGTAFGPDWKNAMIVTYNARPKVVRVRAGSDGSNGRQADFLTGFEVVDSEGKTSIWGRPAGVAISNDGRTLYISDDRAGAIYKITKL